MSFSEMMQSARGPGVIGMVMALFVLLGFGLLFVFAFDDRLQGDYSTIEGLIKSQRREIENLKESIARGEESLGGAGALNRIDKELRNTQAENRQNQTRLADLAGEKSAAANALARKANDFDKYKNDYRSFVRTKAKGQVIERLQTRDGTLYHNVTIREVNPVGMQIMHDGGFKRVLYENLPADIQDYYQFDKKQKDEALAQENSNVRTHEAAVAIVKDEQNRQNAARKEREEQARQDDMRLGISVRQSRIQMLADEIKALETALPLESQKRISRAPQMRIQLANKRKLIETLNMEIARMQSSLSR